MKSHYDVVVVGGQLGGLLSGAVLAKRGFRVLVIDHDALPPTYVVNDVTLPRGPFTFAVSHSPLARHLLAELALHPIFRHRAALVDPAYQLVVPGHRLDVNTEADRFAAEVQREFPDMTGLMAEVDQRATAASTALDGLFESRLRWPPESFFERRAWKAASDPIAQNPAFTRSLLADVPRGHPLRILVSSPHRFASHADVATKNPLLEARHYMAWRHGTARIDGGYAAFRRMILDKLVAHGGEHREQERVDRIFVRRRNAVGVRMAGTADEIGADHILVACDVTAAVRMLSDRGPMEDLLERVGEPSPEYFRYTLNVVLREEAVPRGMGHHVLVARDPRSGEAPLRIEVSPEGAHGHRILSVETLVPRRGMEDVSGYLMGLRDRTLDALRDVVPFMDAHLILIDSPHDGRDAHDFRTNAPAVARDPWGRGPATMAAVHRYPRTSMLGLTAFPVRTPIANLVLCGNEVAPGLGMEGAFLAAESAADVVTRAGKGKRWVRRRSFPQTDV